MVLYEVPMFGILFGFDMDIMFVNIHVCGDDVHISEVCEIKRSYVLGALWCCYFCSVLMPLELGLL